MAGSPRHSLVGEYVYEDMVLCVANQRSVIERVKDIEYQTGDVLLATYPKTGTTWTQEMLWLLCNDGNLEKAKEEVLFKRFPHIELSIIPKGPHLIDSLGKLEGTRTMKTHLPARFFTKVLADTSQKVVVVVRNPKDTLVSLYHFYRMNYGLGNFKGPWDEFFELHKDRHMYCGDFFDWYLGWWQYRNQENVLFITYEDMKSDIKKVITEVARFLGKDLTEDSFDKIAHHLDFDQMKNNKMANYKDKVMLQCLNHDISPFMRKGVVGDWKNYFNKAQSDLIDQQYKDTLEKAGLILRFQ